jgi:hypothetical protein
VSDDGLRNPRANAIDFEELFVGSFLDSGE